MDFFLDSKCRGLNEKNKFPFPKNRQDHNFQVDGLNGISISEKFEKEISCGIIFADTVLGKVQPR